MLAILFVSAALILADGSSAQGGFGLSDWQNWMRNLPQSASASAGSCGDAALWDNVDYMDPNWLNKLVAKMKSNNTANETYPDPSVCTEMTVRIDEDICYDNCSAQSVRWFFNTTSKKCQAFYGCRPADSDGNNFATIEDCGKTCNVKVTNTTTYFRVMWTGNGKTDDDWWQKLQQSEAAKKNETLPNATLCGADMRPEDICYDDINSQDIRWFYNSTTKQCQAFVGCLPKKPGNNFASSRTCGQVCNVTSNGPQVYRTSWGLYRATDTNNGGNPPSFDWGNLFNQGSGPANLLNRWGFGSPQVQGQGQNQGQGQSQGQDQGQDQDQGQGQGQGQVQVQGPVAVRPQNGQLPPQMVAPNGVPYGVLMNGYYGPSQNRGPFYGADPFWGGK